MHNSLARSQKSSLASHVKHGPEAGAVTGVVLPVDGGQSARVG
jgi:hypothetical protein